MNIKREEMRALVRGAYDIQKLRTQMGNRNVCNLKARLGQAPGEKEEEISAEGEALLRDLRKQYKKLTDGIKTFPRKKTFKGTELISSYTELCLMEQFCELEQSEKRHFKRLGSVLEEWPIWTEFFEGVKGVGPAMAGVIISEIDIHKAEYPSSLWAYAGLDVAKDGRGRSRRKEHLVEVEYTDKEGNDAVRVGITFNPFLKTKLMGVLAGSFIRAGENKYEQIYRGYKFRLENNTKHDEKSKGHRDNMAKRYMVKMFLVDLYTIWRELEGLPVAPTYSEAKLGKVHRKA